MLHEVNANPMSLKTRTKPLYISLLLSFLAVSSLVGQCDQLKGSVIVNEVWNDYITEFIELVVVGDPANPSDPVNLEGWIIDDNHATGAGVGSQPGHIKLGDCFSAVEPGSIILLYNSNFQLPAINPANDGTPNAAGVYQLSGTDPCLIKFRSCPNPRARTYDCDPDAQLNISPAAWGRTIPLANSGDVVQVRDPQERLVHALYWIIQDYPGADNPFSVYIEDTESASGHSYQFTGTTNWYDPNQYTIKTENSPGEANSTENANFISALASGQGLEELNLSCEVLTPTNGELNNGSIQLTVGGGFPPYSITVNEEDVTDLSAAGPYVLDNLAAGYYQIEVRDDNSCLVNCELVVSDQTAESLNVCEMPGTMIGMNTDDCFIWQPTEGLEDPSSSMTLASPIETTVYTLIRMDDNGNVLGETEYTVESHAIGVTIYPEEVTVCPATETYLEALTWVPVDQYTISWSTGETEQVIAVTDPGTYSVTLTHNETGCEESASVEVLSSFEGVRIIASANSVCKGKPVQLLAESSAGNEGPFEFEWSTGENKADIEIEEAGIYTVTITNATTACTAETEIDIKSDDISVVIEPSTPIICPSDDLTLQIDGTYAEIKWYDLNDPATVIGQATEQAVLSAGQYEVQVIGNTGCQATAQTEVFDAISEVAAIQQFFEEKGFYAMPIEVLGPITLRSSDQEKSLNNNSICDCASSGSCTEMVMDDARLQIAIDGIPLQDIKAAVEDNLNYFQSEFGYTDTKAIITANDELCDCDDYLAKADNLFQGMELGYWIHLYDDPNSEQDWLYILTNVPTGDTHHPNNDSQRGMLDGILSDLNNDRLPLGDFQNKAEQAIFIVQNLNLDNKLDILAKSSDQAATNPLVCNNLEVDIGIAPTCQPIKLPIGATARFKPTEYWSTFWPDGALTGFTDFSDYSTSGILHYYQGQVDMGTIPPTNPVFKGYYEMTLRREQYNDEIYTSPSITNSVSNPTIITLGKQTGDQIVLEKWNIPAGITTIAASTGQGNLEFDFGGCGYLGELQEQLDPIDIGVPSIDQIDISNAKFNYFNYEGVFIPSPQPDGSTIYIFAIEGSSGLEIYRWDCNTGQYIPFEPDDIAIINAIKAELTILGKDKTAETEETETNLEEEFCFVLTPKQVGDFDYGGSNQPNFDNPSLIDYVGIDPNTLQEITQSIAKALSVWGLQMKFVLSGEDQVGVDPELPINTRLDAHDEFFNTDLDVTDDKPDVVFWMHYNKEKKNAGLCIRVADNFFTHTTAIDRNTGMFIEIPNDKALETKTVFLSAMRDAIVAMENKEELKDNDPTDDEGDEYEPAPVNNEKPWFNGLRTNFPPGVEAEPVNFYSVSKEVWAIGRATIKDFRFPEKLWQKEGDCMFDAAGGIAGFSQAIIIDENPVLALPQLGAFALSVVKDENTRKAIIQMVKEPNKVAYAFLKEKKEVYLNYTDIEVMHYHAAVDGVTVIVAILTGGGTLINKLKDGLSKKAEKAARQINEELGDLPRDPSTPEFNELYENIDDIPADQLELVDEFFTFVGEVGIDRSKKFKLNPELVHFWRKFKGDPDIDIASIFKKLPDDNPAFYQDFFEVLGRRVDADNFEVFDKAKDFFKDINRNDELLARFADDISIRAWEKLKTLGVNRAKRTDPDFLKNVGDWDAVGVTLSRNTNGNLQLNHSSIKIGEFKNGNLIPENNKYDFSPTHSYTGTAIGKPINGYQIIDKGNTRKIRRVPDKSAYSQNEISALTNHPKSHTLERHGHDVPDDALVKRAGTPSVAPDGKTIPTPPSHSSKFENPDRLKDALNETGPNSSSWNPPSNPVNGRTYYRSYTDPNQVPFGYGIPAGGGISNKVQMHKVEAYYNYQAATGKWELSTMYPTP